MMPTFGSLFAGVGGFDLGFEAAGWECRWQVEWDKRCRSVLARHRPDAKRYGDVNDVDGHILAPVDCITYGFPCQDLSVAGNRAGLDGERSGLFFQATRIIREMREATDGRYPTWAVAENVAGLLSADSGAAMGRCLDELADIGAVGIEWGTLDAQHFGVPQRRRRVFIVAWFDPRVGRADPLLPVSARCQGHLEPGGTSREVVAALTGNGVGTCGADDNQGQAGHLIAFHMTQDPISGPVSPAMGLGATHGQAHIGVQGPFGVRRLTPRECERLMGWPDDHTRWDADGNELPDSFRYRSCGNGVAAPVARWIGSQLLAHIEGHQ